MTRKRIEIGAAGSSAHKSTIGRTPISSGKRAEAHDDLEQAAEQSWTGETIKVLLVDDHVMLRKGLAALLREEATMEVVGEAANGQEAIVQARELRPDVVVMDITMPKLNGIEATREILGFLPQCKIIALSIHSAKSFVDDMLTAGAVGYLLKESAPEKLIQAIHSVMNGEMNLSSAITKTVVAANIEGTPDPQDAEQERPALGIVQTKLNPAVTAPDFIDRPHLIDLLNAGRVRPLTLVSAPAGYGKSALISSWLKDSDWPSAWISLDRGDSNLVQFLSYFVAAVQGVFAGACTDTLNLLQGPQVLSMSALVANLSNDLEAIAQPFVLVLDDYHCIDARSEVNDLLQQLLDRPPIPLHLVIVTRHDPPLPRNTLRAQGQVTEVRMGDLRFSRAEAQAFLAQSAEVALSEEAMANVDYQMEGWAAGLRLLSMAVRNTQDADALLLDLRGGVQETREYLLQEVISGLPPKLQEWMLKSAALDRFCAQICDAICDPDETGDTPFSGRKFVDELQQSNLFTVSVAGPGDWYRYHNLFQELLRDQLNRSFTDQQVAALHRRASAWFEDEGLIEDALKQAVSGSQVELAVQIFERNWRPVAVHESWQLIDRWLSVLPVAVAQSKLVMMLARAWTLHYSEEYAALRTLLDRIDEAPSEQRLAFQDDILVLHAYCLFFTGQRTASLESIELALARIPIGDSNIRSQAELVFGLAGQQIGQKELVVRKTDEWLENMTQPSPLRETRLLMSMSCLHYLAAEPSNAKRYLPRLREVAFVHGVLNMVAMSNQITGLFHLQRGELDSAIQCLESAVQARNVNYARAGFDSLASLMVAYQLNGQQQQAESVLKTMREFAVTLGSPFKMFAESSAARLALLQRQTILEIDSWQDACLWDERTMFLWTEIPCLTRCRILIAEGSAKGLQEAQRRLRGYAELNESQHNTLQVIGVTALQAVLCLKRGYGEEALKLIERSLALAEPGGFIFPFVELGSPIVELFELLDEQKIAQGFIARIIDGLPQDEALVGSPTLAMANRDLSEPLTNRELEILRLLAQRLQNKEIAAKLFVSPETVKSHLKSLYQKLAVRNRREAAARAVEILAVAPEYDSGVLFNE